MLETKDREEILVVVEVVRASPLVLYVSSIGGLIIK
jgi:hypothetical protein